VASARLTRNLWKQRLGQVPEAIWDETHLEALILADNDLLEISPRIGELSRLRTLDLGHNRLTELPASGPVRANRTGKRRTRNVWLSAGKTIGV
jgi:Leucine-rich repeat (LRR) protein